METAIHFLVNERTVCGVPLHKPITGTPHFNAVTCPDCLTKTHSLVTTSEPAETVLTGSLRLGYTMITLETDQWHGHIRFPLHDSDHPLLSWSVTLPAPVTAELTTHFAPLVECLWLLPMLLDEYRYHIDQRRVPEARFRLGRTPVGDMPRFAQVDGLDSRGGDLSCRSNLQDNDPFSDGRNLASQIRQFAMEYLACLRSEYR